MNHIRRDASARSFERRLRLGLLAMMVPAALAAAVLLAGLVQVTSNHDHVGEELAEELQSVAELRHDFALVGRATVDFADDGDRRHERDVRALGESIEANLDLTSEFDEAVEVRLSNEIHLAWDRGSLAAERVFAGARTARADLAVAVQQFEIAADRLAELDAISRVELLETVESSSRTSGGIVLSALVIGVLAVVLTVLIIRHLVQATFDPLRQLALGVAQFSVEDVDHRIEVEGDREFQAVGNAVNDMADRLQDTLGSLEHQAFHDALTGLANRASLVRQLRTPGPEDRTVLLFDLDGFKAINDGLGHAAGDEALIKIGYRMKQAIRPGDLVARLGGDEFAIVLDDAASLRDVEDVALRITRCVSEPLEIAGRAVVLHASGGVAAANAGDDPAETLRRADIALYVAKAVGKGTVRAFSHEMLRDVERRLDLETDLRLAVAKGEIEVHYQPTVSIASGMIIGVEALARWRHPEHGLIPPLTFIPVAEASGQILALGRFVLTSACEQAKRWQQLPGLSQLNVSVNVSATQLHDPVILDDVATALRGSGLAASSLTLEVTETVMADPEAVARVHELKATGIRVALDDFGTGYSSLSYLQRLPIDVLKIDKSFIDDVAGKADSAILASAIVRLGRSLGLETVAEGVEESEQLRVLSSVGCEVVQGYLFARPEGPLEIEARLLELAAAGPQADAVRTDDQPDDSTRVRIELGPVPAGPVREWLQHAHWAIDELEAGRLLERPVPTPVIAVMREYVQQWTVAAMEDSFSWVSVEDVELMRVLMRFWLPVSVEVTERVRRGDFTLSEDAVRLADGLVHTILVALSSRERHGGFDAAILARAWPEHEVL